MFDELDGAGNPAAEVAVVTQPNTPAPSSPTGGNEGTPPQGTAPAQTNAQQTPAPGSVPGQQTGGQNPAPQEGNGAGQSGGQASTDWKSARDYYERALGQQGVASQFQDDESFLRHLAEQNAAAAQMRQDLQLAQQREQMLMQQALQARQAVAPTPPAEKPKWFAPPEYNPAWERLIVKDPATGNLSVPAGHDPTIVAKYTAYHEFRRNWAEKLFTDPEGTLSPFVEDRAKTLAEQAVQTHMAAYQERVQADQFIRDNAAWLQVRGQDGRPVIDPRTSRPQLTPAGRNFLGHLHAAIQGGLKGFDAQVQYAQGMTQRDALAEYYRGQQQQQGLQQQGNQARANLLQTANRRPSQTGSEGAGNPQNAPPQNPGLSFRDQLTAAMAAAGITDADIVSEPARA